MKLELRTEKLRKVRAAHKIPGVMFGKSIESTSIQVEEKAFKDALKTYGKSMTFEATLDGKKHQVYIQNVSTQVLKPDEVIHFDLHRVSETETISAVLHIVLVGKEVFFDSGLFIHEELSEVHAEFKPGHGISKITVDVSELKEGDIIRVKDLNVPEDVKIKADPEHVVLEIREVKVVPEETEEEDEEVVETEEAADEE